MLFSKRFHGLFLTWLIAIGGTERVQTNYLFVFSVFHLLGYAVVELDLPEKKTVHHKFPLKVNSAQVDLTTLSYCMM